MSSPRRAPGNESASCRSPSRCFTSLPTQLYPPTVSTTLTCPKCGNTWESYASSARTRCGACRSAVSVPTARRHGSVDRPAASTTTNSSPRETYEDDQRESAPGGATVVVVVGLVALAVIAFIWYRRRTARKAQARPADTLAQNPPYTFTAPAATLRPNGTAQLSVGATTRWSCGHEQTLVQPLAPGLTPSSAPCPTCGRAGIVAQLVGGRFVPVAL